MAENRTDSIYWSEKVKRKVQELARQDRRSVSAEICWLISSEHERRSESGEVGRNEYRR